MNIPQPEVPRIDCLLIQSVKIGRGYFAILKAESALKKRQQQLQKLKEEERNKFQPAKKFSDIQYGDALLTTYDDDKLKKLGTEVILRPFTPVHSCIISSSLPEAHVEPLFRQLCALHWLLEALTIDHTHHTMKPVITCWNTKDPGGSKSTIKKLNKDKSMGQRWEHFVSAPKTKKFKIPALRATSRKPSRRGSTLSLSRTSGGSSPQSSMVSMNPGSDEPQSVTVQVVLNREIEDNESSSTKPDEEPLHINLQKLLEMVREDARRTIMTENGMQKKAPSILSVLKQNKSDSVTKNPQTTHKSRDRSSWLAPKSRAFWILLVEPCIPAEWWRCVNAVRLESPVLSVVYGEESGRVQRELILQMERTTPYNETEIQKIYNADSIQAEGKVDLGNPLCFSDRTSSTSGDSHTQISQKKSKGRTNRDFIQYKSGVCNIMRAKFYSVAQEAGFCLQDKMEILMKRQEERGLQKFRSFVLASNFQKDIAKMRHQVSTVKGDAEEIADHWYFDLLSKLPEDLKSFRPARKILTKLQKFGENLDLRIRPHVLLKVLQELRIWELCSPDIAVAIEFVREHIIHMPQEDYISWLQNRVNIPIRPHSALT
ncbi:Coiled-coil domain-containing protein 60 [Tupaia chinensis]|uniref:Coiled-coil domain-containing protein 60 n=1 Tax=Tupaia chinensis TaxID=246437 RepID=L9KM60_TUPCH|nr:Coiled-coil domain-containing protein 60 [Tupaia chinensis]